MLKNFKSLMLGQVELKREFYAGLTTFLTMSYIVVVNPSILSAQVNGVAVGLSFSAVMTSTVLLAASMTLLMGLYAKLPFAVAPGMGINAFFAYTLVISRGIPVERALGMVFWAGVLFLLISVTPIRMKIAQAIPSHLRMASAGGIGLFLAFIGFKNAGWVVADPVTFVKMGHFDQNFWISLTGLLVLVGLLIKKSRLAFLGGILASCAVAFLFAAQAHQGSPSLDVKAFVSWPDFSGIGKLDLLGALYPATWSAIVSILFTDLFDSLSTFVGVSEATGLKGPDGQPKNLREGLIVDAWATLAAGFLGTSSGTAYIESAAGIEAGGRTGWTAIFAALLFIPCLFFGPLAALIPGAATAPVLIVVGVLMFRSVLAISATGIKGIEDVLPVVLTIVLIPFTFSITQGMLWGFLLHAPLYLLAGRKKEVSPWMGGISALAGALLLFEHLLF